MSTFGHYRNQGFCQCSNLIMFLLYCSYPCNLFHGKLAAAVLCMIFLLPLPSSTIFYFYFSLVLSHPSMSYSLKLTCLFHGLQLFSIFTLKILLVCLFPQCKSLSYPSLCIPCVLSSLAENIQAVYLYLHCSIGKLQRRQTLILVQHRFR